jgi:type IV pilus assembly protein PilC
MTDTISHRPDRVGDIPLNLTARQSAVTSQQLTDFTRQLATLVSSGVPLLESLDAIHKGLDGQAMAPIAETLKARVSAGWSLQQALQEHAVFSHLYCQMVALAAWLMPALLQQLSHLYLQILRLLRRLLVINYYMLRLVL